MLFEFSVISSAAFFTFGAIILSNRYAKPPKKPIAKTVANLLSKNSPVIRMAIIINSDNKRTNPPKIPRINELIPSENEKASCCSSIFLIQIKSDLE